MQQPETKATGAHCSWGEECHEGERETEPQRAKARILAETRQHWISLGMIREEDAHLLEKVESPYHPRIDVQGKSTSRKRKKKSRSI